MCPRVFRYLGDRHRLKSIAASAFDAHPPQQQSTLTTAMAPLVLVTGPSGFIGAHVFTQLLKNGYTVRGTVRSQSKADYFIQKYPAAARSRQISFVIVKDIAQPGAFKNAVKGPQTTWLSGFDW